MEHDIVVAELKGRIAAFKEKHSYLYDDSQKNRLQSGDTFRTGTTLQSSNAETNKTSFGSLRK